MNKPREDLLRINLSRIDAYFSLVNVKASLILPTNAIFVGFFVTSIRDLTERLTKVLGVSGAMVLLSLTLLLFIASSVAALKVVFAFLKSGGSVGEYHSLMFFGSIREMKKEVFKAKVLASTGESFEEDLIEQIYLLSCALSRKYRALNFSVILMGLGVVALGVLSVISYWS